LVVSDDYGAAKLAYLV